MTKRKGETDENRMNEELKRGLRYVEPFVTIVGAWPLGPESATFLKILQPFIAPICFFLVSFSIWPGFYYIFFKERDGKRRLKMILPVFHSMFQLAQYIVVLSKMKNIRMVLDDIRNDWFDTTEENRQFFRECTKVGNKIMSILVIGVMGGGIGFRIILPLLKGRIVLPDNTTIRLLPCPIYLPFINDQVTPYYEIIFTLQALSGICNYTILISTNAIILMISLHMCGLIRILRKKMTDFTEKSIISEMSIQRNIVTIVEHHTKIKIFLSNGQTITEYICFLALANIVFLMCLLGYCVTLELENYNASALMVYFIMITTCLFSSYVICSIGQLLLDESDNFAQTCITLDWYRFPPKKARYLIPIIIMSNYPIKLTALKVVEVSLSTYTNIVKMTVGYINMLREVV